MDSYKTGNENLQTAEKECHVLTSGENFVLFSILKLRYVDFSIWFLTYRRRYLLGYTHCSHKGNFNTVIFTLEYLLTVTHQCLTHTPQYIPLPSVSNNGRELNVHIRITRSYLKIET